MKALSKYFITICFVLTSFQIFAGDTVSYSCVLEKLTCSTCREGNYQDFYKVTGKVITDKGLTKFNGSEQEDIYIGFSETRAAKQAYYKVSIYFTPNAGEPMTDAQAKWSFSVLKKQKIIENTFVTEEDTSYGFKCERD